MIIYIYISPSFIQSIVPSFQQKCFSRFRHRRRRAELRIQGFRKSNFVGNQKVPGEHGGDVSSKDFNVDPGHGKHQKGNRARHHEIRNPHAQCQRAPGPILENRGARKILQSFEMGSLHYFGEFLPPTFFVNTYMFYTYARPYTHTASPSPRPTPFLSI